MYQLYHNKEQQTIKVGKLQKVFSDVKGITDELKFWNENYYFCSDRKKLKEKANEIRNQWIKEAKEQIEKAKEIIEKFENVQIK